MKPTVQLIGPYTPRPGRPYITVADNIAAARRAARRIHEAGAYCICPHLNTASLGMAEPYDHFVDGPISMIHGLSSLGDHFAVYVLYGYQESPGSMRELSVAISLEVRRFYEKDGMGALLDWVRRLQ